MTTTEIAVTARTVTAGTGTPPAAVDAAELHTLLRRYTIVPGHWSAFLAVWRQIIEVRRDHGFEVVIAMADREHDLFTWVVTYRGDLDAGMKAYYADARRIALQTVEDHVSAWDVNGVEMQDLG